MPTQTQPQAIPSIQQAQFMFQEQVTAEVVRTLLRESGQSFYERLFTPLIVVWCFLFQRLNADHTCDAVLSQVGSGSADQLDHRHLQPFSVRMRSENTAALCQARKRLPLSVLQGVMRHLSQVALQCWGEEARWRGHPVALLDGSTLLLTPQPELVSHYGQPKNQHGPCYWVVMRVVVAFCLRTATLLAYQEGPNTDSEQALGRAVLSQLAADAVCIADRNFGVFSLVQRATFQRIFPLFRLTARRAGALAKGRMRSGADRAVQWAPSDLDQCDPTLPQTPIRGRLLYVHLERDGFRPVDLYLFTTLLEATRYPLPELVKLYGSRWQVELDLRYLKSSLDMQMLAAKSVAMVRKELCAGLAAYNLVRAWMTQAAPPAKLLPSGLSFTKCWRRVRDMLSRLRPDDSPAQVAAVMERLVARLSKCKLQKRRPFRLEPRAKRRRPAVYPALKGSRAAARELEAKQQLELSKC